MVSGFMTGLDQFLERYARRPQLIRERLLATRRKRRLNDDEVLCRAGDAAECFWIVDEGIVVVGDGNKIVRRHKGELIGEIAFHRREETKRSVSMKADGITSLWEIDRSFVDKLTAEQRSEWFETVAAVLADKVIEATQQRSRLLSDNVSLDQVLRRFVCDDGLMAVNAAFDSTNAGEIDPDQTDALLWFSDVAGFSSFSKDLSPGEAGRQMRRFMDVQVEEIRTAGGEIDKFTGDGLMAFWRLPDETRSKDRIPKAFRAALAAIDRIRSIVVAEQLPLDIRIGLHLGPVVIGDFGGTGRIAYTVMGETVNSASRYEQARSDTDGMRLGRLRISEAVYPFISEPDLLKRLSSDTRRFVVKGDREFATYTSIDQES